MLTIAGRSGRLCDGISRRSFLRIGSLALGGLGLPDILRAQGKSAAATPHKAIIMVFLPGGPSHQDIWDLKPDAPAEFRGEFRPIDTAVSGIQICEHLPNLASMMDKFTIIRSLVGASGEHASELCYSGYGYRDSLQRDQPSLGSAVSKLQGPTHPSIPPFVSMSQPTPNNWGNQGRYGFCGPAHAPFQPDGEGLKDMVLNGVTLDRLADRNQLLSSVDQFRRDVDASGVIDGLDVYTKQAVEVLTSSRLIEALDISSKEQRIKKRSDQPSYVPRTKEEEEFDEKTNEQIKQLTQRLNFSEDQIQSHVEYIMLYSDKSTTMILAHSVVVVFWTNPSHSSSLFLW